MTAEYTHTAAYISGSKHARSNVGYVRRPLKKKGVEKAARPSARLKVLPSAVPLCQNIQSSSHTLVTYRVGEKKYSTFSLYNESNGWWLQYFKKAR